MLHRQRCPFLAAHLTAMLQTPIQVVAGKGQTAQTKTLYTGAAAPGISYGLTELIVQESNQAQDWQLTMDTTSTSGTQAAASAFQYRATMFSTPAIAAKASTDGLAVLSISGGGLLSYEVQFGSTMDQAPRGGSLIMLHATGSSKLKIPATAIYGSDAAGAWAAVCYRLALASTTSTAILGRSVLSLCLPVCLPPYVAI